MQLKTPGGIERFISTLATMFSEDYQIEIIANYGKLSNQLAFPLPKNIKLTFLTPIQPKEISMKNLIAKFKWHHIPNELKRRHEITSTRNKAFKKYLQTLNTNYIITDRALYNSLVAKYYHGNAKKIATDHNFHQNNLKYINELLTSIKTFDALVVATKELKNFYTTKTSIKCVAIPNPLPEIPTQKSSLSTKNLISVGRLVPEKDFPMLIDTMHFVHQQDPDIHLTIVGDGSERQKLKSQIKSLNLESTITLTGWLPQEQITKLYLDSSLFVMTSKTEAFGLVLTEAMSYGLPCLALTRASGARAQITQNTGILLNTENPRIIANTITESLNSPDNLRSYQVQINRNIQNYNATKVQKQWQKLLSSIS